LSKPIKIAIYSGQVPSTTFIERLVIGLASSGLYIYRFGLQKEKIKSSNNIFYSTYSNKLGKLFILFKYSVLLRLFKSHDKKKLDVFIETQSLNSMLLKVKYYPVLYHRPDIFHLQWAKSIADWIWVQEFGIKLIVSLRGAHINYSPIANTELAALYRNVFPKVDGFHAVSNAIAKEARKYNAFKEKIKTIYSGLDLEQINFNPKTFDSNTPTNIISIGRAHWKKGYSYALDAMNLIDEEKIDFNYTIVGVKNNEELLYKRSQLNCRNKINFTDKLDFSEVKDLVKNADALLLSSIEEGIANVVLEAMALGTLVISTTCGGMSEVIENSKNGFLVPIRNSKAIADAIKQIKKISKEDYISLTKAARDTVEEKHNQDFMISGMKSFYQSVLKEKLCE
jgi:colanic acid/amylovoran biosynthesis glycosyltransferase